MSSLSSEAPQAFGPAAFKRIVGRAGHDLPVDGVQDVLNVLQQRLDRHPAAGGIGPVPSIGAEADTHAGVNAVHFVFFTYPSLRGIVHAALIPET